MTSTKTKPPTYWVTLAIRPENQPHDQEGVHRLRRWLKAILRNYGLRCEDFRVERPDDVRELQQPRITENDSHLP